MPTVIIAAPISNKPTWVSGAAGRALRRAIGSEYPKTQVVFIPDDKCINEYASIIQKCAEKNDGVLFSYFGHGKPSKLCLPPESEIITKDGIKRIDQVQTGDLVLTHTGEFHAVNKVYKRQYTGEMVEITPVLTDVPLKLTPEHPVLAMNCDRCSSYPSRFCYPTCTYLGKTCKSPIYSELEWIESKNLSVRDIIVYPRHERSIKKESFKISDVVDLDLSSQERYEKIMALRAQGMGNWGIANALDLPYKTSADRYIYKGVKPALRLENGVIISSSGNGERCLFDEIIVDDDFMKLAGFYVSEGHVDAQKTGVAFTFGTHEQDYVDEVQNIVKTKFGFPTHTRSGNGATVVHIGSGSLARFFYELFGTGAKVKTIPTWIMYADKSLQRRFIEYLYRGDGQTKFDNRVRVRYISASKQLVDDLRIMLLNFGIVCGYSYGKYITPTGKDSGCYSLEVSARHYQSFKSLFNIPIPESKPRGAGWSDDDYVYIPIKHKKTTEYSGFVYNLEVDVDNSYVANYITVHNCGQIPPGCGKSKPGMVDPDNVPLLKNIITHATACWSAVELGRLAEEIGAKAYLGSRSPCYVAFPMDEHNYQKDIINVWNTFPLSLLDGNSVADSIGAMLDKSREYESFFAGKKEDWMYADYYSTRFKRNRDILVPFGDLAATLVG